VPSGHPPGPQCAAVVAGLTIEVAEIGRRISEIAANANALLADVEAVGAVLLEVSGMTQSAGTVEAPLPLVQSEDVAAQAVRLAVGWIQRSHHHPLRGALVMLEGWTLHLHDVVDRGFLPSPSVVAEASVEDECPFGRWLTTPEAEKLDPERTAEARILHTQYHAIASRVLAAVGDGDIDRARTLLESEDGHAGVSRRLTDLVRTWCEEVVD